MVVMYIFSATFVDEGMLLYQCGECLVISEGIGSGVYLYILCLSIFCGTNGCESVT